jgi:hypothetical protein
MSSPHQDPHQEPASVGVFALILAFVCLLTAVAIGHSLWELVAPLNTLKAAKSGF